MPQLLHARANADYDNEIWNSWFFTSNSEESVAKTPLGDRVVVAVHGGGIFATPARFRKLYHASVNRSCKVGFTGLFGAKISEREAHDVLDGKLPDGTEIPVFYVRRIQARRRKLAAALRCRHGLRDGEEIEMRVCIV